MRQPNNDGSWLVVLILILGGVGAAVWLFIRGRRRVQQLPTVKTVRARPFHDQGRFEVSPRDGVTMAGLRLRPMLDGGTQRITFESTSVED
jgi:hypothetical protein